jgi:hypothetical protein
MIRGAQVAVSLRRLSPHIELLALISLLTLFMFKTLVPAWISLRSDFPNYYIVARLLREHYSMDRIYDWIWLQRVKDHWSIPQPLVGFVGLTPFSALPLVPLTWLDALEAKRVWLVVNLAILGASVYGMQQITSLRARRVALIAFVAIIPLRNNFLLGQMHLVVLVLLALAFHLNAEKRWLQCSLVLSVAASLKVYPLFFALYFLRKHEWKPAAALVSATVAIFAGCFLIFGEPAMHAFLVEQFPRMLRGEAMDPFSLSAPSASSLFHRVFLVQPEANPSPLFPSPLLYAILYPLWQLILLVATLLMVSPKDRDPQHTRLEWAAWICMLLALSTEPASYHRVVLILVAVFAVNAIEGGWRRAIMLGCYFVACNVHPAVTVRHPILALMVDFVPFWATVALLACLLASLRIGRGETTASGSSSRSWSRMRTAWALGIFAVIWAAASEATFVHARELNNSSYRMDRPDPDLAQFSPHVAGSHLLSVAMQLKGYRVEDEGGTRFQTSKPGIEDDQLAVASSKNSDRIWIEAVSGGHSRLVELGAIPGEAAPAPDATIVDAESPALSPDGRSLMFLRENRGRGRAWLVRLDESGQPLTEPAPISPEEMDVWDAQFSASDGILLCAAADGHPYLFLMRSGKAKRLFADTDAMGVPATHAGNGVLVRQQRRDGYWHLYRSDPSRQVETQLTFGDCNAYDPAWLDESRVVYVSDCGRGEGIGALAEIDLGTATGASGRTSANPPRTGAPGGEPQK